MNIQLPFNFKPREYQLPFMNAMHSGIKRACLVWHRRSGKDKTALNFMVNEMFKRVGSYYYFFPTQKQGRKVIWDGMDFDGFKFMNHFPKSIVARSREDEMKKELINGSIFQLVGSDNFDSVMGTNPVGLIMSEYSLHDPRAWDFFRPILRENKGWVVFLYTPRGKNHGYHLYNRVKKLDTWFTQILTVNDTLKDDGTSVLTPVDIQAERDEGMEEDMIRQEYYCSFEGGLAGAVYGDAMNTVRNEGRICHVPHDKDIPVYTYWDIGYRDAAAVWFLQFPSEHQINAIRYYENTKKDVSHYIDYMNNLMSTDGYNYGDHFGPHDMASRSFGHGDSPQEVARALNYEFQVVERSRNITHGIQNVRKALRTMKFDEENCGLGIDALESYTYVFDAKWKRYSDQPAHSWASHGADALRTFAEGQTLGHGGGMTEAQAQALVDKYVYGISDNPLDSERDDFFEEDFDY